MPLPEGKALSSTFHRAISLTLLPAAFVSAVLFTPAVRAQTPAPATDNVRPTYLKLCAGCHGSDARGTQQGPGLAGNPSVRRRSMQNLRNIIIRGIPAAGMPAF